MPTILRTVRFDVGNYYADLSSYVCMYVYWAHNISRRGVMIMTEEINDFYVPTHVI